MYKRVRVLLHVFLAAHILQCIGATLHSAVRQAQSSNKTVLESSLKSTTYEAIATLVDEEDTLSSLESNPISTPHHTNSLYNSNTRTPSMSPTSTTTNVVGNETHTPSMSPTSTATAYPTINVVGNETHTPSMSPTYTAYPTINVVGNETHTPSMSPSSIGTPYPTINDHLNETEVPTISPSHQQSAGPTGSPSVFPSNMPVSSTPSSPPSLKPTYLPTLYPTYRPTRSPTYPPSHMPTEVPTPAGESGSEWWYLTRAVVGVNWDSSEAPLDDASKIINDAFYDVFKDMMYASLSKGMSTTVEASDGGSRSHRRLLRMHSERSGWQDFTLLVWTIPSGSAQQVRQVLSATQRDPQLVITPMREDGLTTVSSVFVHDIVTSTTTEGPHVANSNGPHSSPLRIVWIIFWTVVVFAFGVCGISALKQRCNSRHDPFTYNAPRSVSSICCPCFFDGSRRPRLPRRNQYMKYDDDDGGAVGMEMSSDRNVY